MDPIHSPPMCTDDVIEALVHASCGESASAHERYLYRESLRNLVRLAKAEQRQRSEAGARQALRLAHRLH